MVQLTTNTGRIILCDAVVEGRNPVFLHIHTKELTRVDAEMIFGNPEETAVLISQTILPEDQTPAEPVRHIGFTDIYSVQKSPFIFEPGELLIWMQRPERSSEEETA